MTTVEAIQQCLHNTRVEDLSNVSSRDALVLVGALNGAIAEMFDLAPPNHKITTASYHLAAPETVSGIVLASGATTVSSGTPFTSSHRGCTIQLTGDPQYNEVVSTTAVLKPYLGSTATPFTGQLWHDALPLLDFSIERLISHPRVSTATGEDGVELIPVDPASQPSYGYPFQGEANFWHQFVEGTGTPRYYKVNYVGGTIQSENDAVVILQVAPKPDVAMNLTFEMHLRPQVYAITALTVAAEIPVTRTRPNHLLPLIQERLMASPLWIGSPSINREITVQAARARMECANMPNTFAPPVHRAGTRSGW